MTFVLNLANLRRHIHRDDIFRMSRLLLRVFINGIEYRRIGRDRWVPMALVSD